MSDSGNYEGCHCSVVCGVSSESAVEVWRVQQGPEVKAIFSYIVTLRQYRQQETLVQAKIK